MAAILPILSILSSLAPLIAKGFGGDSSKGGMEGYNRVSTFDPQQQQLFGQSAQGLGNLQPKVMEYLQQLLQGGGESEQAFSAPYMRQFNEETVPALAERFAGVGGLSSSGFQQSLGKAGAGLQENLASLREGQRSQAISPIMQMIQGLLGQQTQAFSPKQPGGFQNFFSSLAPSLAQGVTQYGLSKLKF